MHAIKNISYMRLTGEFIHHFGIIGTAASPRHDDSVFKIPSCNFSSIDVE
jgi:hypothetical protein